VTHPLKIAVLEHELRGLSAIAELFVRFISTQGGSLLRCHAIVTSWTHVSVCSVQ